MINIEQTHTVALPANAETLLVDYFENLQAIPSCIAALESAQNELENASSVGGAYSGPPFDRTRPHEGTIKKTLRKNVWRAIYRLYKIDEVAPANDRKRLEAMIEEAHEPTPDFIVQAFGDYLINPRHNLLRGFAEIFTGLDDAYKSHSKVKIGVKGLPKRVIMKYMFGFGWHDSVDKLNDLLRALQVFDDYGMPDRQVAIDIVDGKRDSYRGLTFKRFKKAGTLHIHFDEHACLQANRCLAEFYGDVLPDVEPDKTHMKPDLKGQSVSKDLQYYPTPKAVCDALMNRISITRNGRILEPSCGCGRLLDALSSAYPQAELRGVEYHMGRARQARDKGHNVVCANFLSLKPAWGDKYDAVVMNPPFYGLHYAKHIRHAMKFIQDDGVIYSILPATAYYDHKEIEIAQWWDLPVASFSESGTRVPTGIAKIYKSTN